MSPSKILSFFKKITPEYLFMMIAGAMLSYSKGIVQVGLNKKSSLSSKIAKLKKLAKIIKALIKGIQKAISLLVKLFTPPVGWVVLGILVL